MRQTRWEWLSRVLPLKRAKPKASKKNRRGPKPERVWLVTAPGWAPVTVTAHTAGEARARAKLLLKSQGRLPAGTKTEALEPAP